MGTARSARLREATAMVKEVGDKINGMRGGQVKRPSLPSQESPPAVEEAVPSVPPHRLVIKHCTSYIFVDTGISEK